MALGTQKLEELKRQLQQQQQVEAPVETTTEETAVTEQPGLGTEQFEQLKTQLQQQQGPEVVGGQRGPLRELAGIVPEIREDIQRRIGRGKEAVEAGRVGEQLPVETGLQVAGQAVGGLGDIAGRTLMGAAEAVLPEAVERPIARGFEEIVGAVAGTKPAQELISLSERIKTTNPRLARNIQAILSVGEAGATIGTGGAVGVGARAAAPAVRRGVTTAAKETGKAALRTTGQAGRVATRGAGLGSELILGTRIARSTRTAFEQPRLFEEFASGNRTTKSVSRDLTRSTDKVAQESFDALERVKNELPKFQIDRNIVEGNISDIVDSAFIDPGRASKRVERLETIIRDHEDFTPKGLLNLNTKIRRQGLFNAASDDLQTSNRVIRDVTREIKEAATELIEDKRILDELNRSSETIRQLEDVGYTFKVKPEAKPDQINKALTSLARKIDDPNQVEDARRIMQFIKEQTGFDLERQLTVMRAAENLSQEISQGDITAGVRQALGRVIAPIATRAGRARRAVTGVQEEPFTQTFIREPREVTPSAQRTPGQIVQEQLVEEGEPGRLRRRLR